MYRKALYSLLPILVILLSFWLRKYYPKQEGVIMMVLLIIGIYLIVNSATREKYADQVVHAGVGGIAGPMGRYMDQPGFPKGFPETDEGLSRWYL
jgi:hypothetical protein